MTVLSRLAPISRIATIAAASLVLSGCIGGALKQAPIATYDLTAPQSFSGRAAANRGILVIDEPTAIQTVDSNRIVARTGGQITYVPNAQWTDRLPVLLQTRMVQAFENAGRIGSVGRTQDRLSGTYQLITDIRAFEIDASSVMQARIEIAAKIVDHSGRVRSGRVFSASVPAGPVSGPAASVALDRALAEVLVQLVSWTNGQV